MLGLPALDHLITLLAQPRVQVRADCLSCSLDDGSERLVAEIGEKEVMRVLGEPAPHQIRRVVDAGRTVDAVGDLVQSHAVLVAEDERRADRLRLVLPLDDPKQRRPVLSAKRTVKLALGLPSHDGCGIEDLPVVGHSDVRVLDEIDGEARDQPYVRSVAEQAVRVLARARDSDCGPGSPGDQLLRIADHELRRVNRSGGAGPLQLPIAAVHDARPFDGASDGEGAKAPLTRLAVERPLAALGRRPGLLPRAAPALEGTDRLGVRHTVAVICDADGVHAIQLGSADLDRDRFRVGVERVPDQLGRAGNRQRGPRERVESVGIDLDNEPLSHGSIYSRPS